MLLRILVAVALLSAAPRADARGKTQITIEVRNQDNEPVDRASVIVKPLRGSGKVRRAYELRTSQQGTAPLPPLNTGTFLVQVIAKGYQTHGEKYEVTEPERIIKIQLQPPQDQFSVHK